MQILKKIILSSCLCFSLSACIIQPLYKKSEISADEGNKTNIEISCSKIPLKVCSRFKNQLIYKMNAIQIKGLQKLQITLSYTTGDIAISDKATTFRKQSQLKIEGFGRWEKDVDTTKPINYDTPLKLTKVSSFGVDQQMEWASFMAEESRLIMLIDPLVDNIIQTLSIHKT